MVHTFNFIVNDSMIDIDKMIHIKNVLFRQTLINFQSCHMQQHFSVFNKKKIKIKLLSCQHMRIIRTDTDYVYPTESTDIA